MSKVSDAITNAFSGPLRQALSDCWTNAGIAEMARTAATYIDLDQCSFAPHWNNLDDPKQRILLVPAAVTESLCITKLCEQHRTEINNAISSIVSPPSLTQLRKELSSVVRLYATSPASSSFYSANPFPKILQSIANSLAGPTHDGFRSGSITHEWRLLNRLFIIEFLMACRLPSARLVSAHILELSKGLLSIRGKLVRLPEQLLAIGVHGTVVPLSPRNKPIKLSCSRFSDTLDGLERETKNVLSRNGFMHRIIPPEKNATVPTALKSIISNKDVIESRHRAYLQYEHTINGYMALCGIEQLMRCWASNRGVAHIDARGVPKSLPQWLHQLHCSQPLMKSIEELYSMVRNRIVHGGLIEIESKRLEALIDIADKAIGPLPVVNGTDPLAPFNIASLCLDCLESIENELSKSISLKEQDFDWISQISLTKSEIDFGAKLHCEFLETEELAEKWRLQIVTYNRSVVPIVSQFFNTGFHGWIRKYTPDDSLVQFLSLGFIFEATYRLTAHLMGIDILQIDRKNAKFQYKMLDENGLCAQPVLDRLLSSLNVSDRAMAQQTLLLPSGESLGFLMSRESCSATVFAMPSSFVPRAKLVPRFFLSGLRGSRKKRMMFPPATRWTNVTPGCFLSIVRAYETSAYATRSRYTIPTKKPTGKRWVSPMYYEKMVGAAGFEPATSCTPSKRANPSCATPR